MDVKTACAATIAACAAAYLYHKVSTTTPVTSSPSLTTTEKRNLLANIPRHVQQQCHTIYHGAIIHSITFDDLQVIENGLLGVDHQGKICLLTDLDQSTSPTTPQEASTNTTNTTDTTNTTNTTDITDNIHIVSLGSQFICPGFIDAHAHAPQHAFTGTGMDLPLLEWLQRYTFPHESKFSNLKHARKVYDRAVSNHLKNGSTTVSYFATIHPKSCMLLVDIVRERGQRALVGKVNMDRNSPDDYCETTEDSLRDTQIFVDYVLNLKDDTVIPVITPRFVPTCTPTLMKGLGKIAATHTLPIQSHMGETVEECGWVRSLHPESTTYSDVYIQHDLMPLEVSGAIDWLLFLFLVLVLVLVLSFFWTCKRLTCYDLLFLLYCCCSV